MSAEEGIATIPRVIDAVNARDFAVLRNAAHAEFKRHDLAGALPETSGAAGPADLIHLLIRAMPDMHIDIKQSLAAGDRVAVHLVVRGTHQGELLGVPGTGKPIELHGVNLYRLMGGKIAETWQLLDVWGLMRQLGKA